MFEASQFSCDTFTIWYFEQYHKLFCKCSKSLEAAQKITNTLRVKQKMKSIPFDSRSIDEKRKYCIPMTEYKTTVLQTAIIIKLFSSYTVDLTSLFISRSMEGLFHLSEKNVNNYSENCVILLIVINRVMMTWSKWNNSKRIHFHYHATACFRLHKCSVSLLNSPNSLHKTSQKDSSFFFKKMSVLKLAHVTQLRELVHLSPKCVCIGLSDVSTSVDWQTSEWNARKKNRTISRRLIKVLLHQITHAISRQKLPFAKTYIRHWPYGIYVHKCVFMFLFCMIFMWILSKSIHHQTGFISMFPCYYCMIKLNKQQTILESHTTIIDHFFNESSM